MADLQLLGHVRSWLRRRRDNRFLDKLPQLRCRVCGQAAVAGTEGHDNGHRLAPVCDRHATEAARFGLRVVWSDELNERVVNTNEEGQHDRDT